MSCYTLKGERPLMTRHDWITGRHKTGLTQIDAAKKLGMSQAYLSQLEKGTRVAGAALAEKAARFYNLTAALPLPQPDEAVSVDPDRLEKELAALGYPKFSHAFKS